MSLSRGLAHGGDHTGGVVRSEGGGWTAGASACRGQHVAGVAEGRDVTERRHVSGETAGLNELLLGEVLQRVMHLFALLDLLDIFGFWSGSLPSS